MLPRQILERILARQGVAEPDGRPLWAYCASEGEVAELLEFFREEASCPRELLVHEQGALALVVSHVLCRFEVSPSWSWAPVWATLRWAESLPSLYVHLEDGMRLFWRRPVRRTGEADRRTFLGTFFVEGGLPRGWLDTRHEVGRTIRRLVSLCELHELPASVFSSGQLSHLAGGIQCEEIEALCVQVADALVQLRSRLPPLCENPVQYLDSVDESWRARLPLRISGDANCSGLVNGFLSVTSTSENALPLLEFSTFLDVATGTCRRKLRVADRITPEQLAVQTGLKLENLGCLLYLVVQTKAGVRHQIARMECRGGDGGSPTWFVAKTAKLPALDASEPVASAIVLRGDLLTQFVAPGSEVLADDMPWVFSLTSDRNPTLLGVGACATRHERALVFVPEASRIDADGADATVLASPHAFVGRESYEVSGRVRCQVGGESYTIETRAAERSGQLVLRGPRMTGAFGVDAPFAGVPQLLVATERGVTSVPSQALSWKPLNHQGAWRPWHNGMPLGSVCVRCERTGGGWLRTQLSIVPAELQVGKNASTHIRLFHRDLLEVRSHSSDLRVQRDAAKGFFLKPDEGSSLADADISLVFRDAAPIRITVAVPCRDAGFINPKGQWLASGSRVSIDELDGLRARAPAKERVQLEVRASGGTWERLQELRRGATGIAELYLVDVRDELTALLRSSAFLDEYIEVRVTPLGWAPERFSVLQVGNYGLELGGESDSKRATFFPTRVRGARLGDAECSRLDLRVMSLTHPEAEWKAFIRVDDHWDIPFEGLDPGPYLAILEENGVVCGRPRALFVPGACDVGSSAFSMAANRSSPAEREGAWLALCTAMAGDWNHPDWNRFRALIRSGSPLPASSFDAMRVAAEVPDFLAVALLREVSADGQREVLREFEEVGVFWPTIALKSWISAINGARRFVQNTPGFIDLFGGQDKALGSLCPLFGAPSVSALPFLSLIRSLALRSLSPGLANRERGLSIPPAQVKLLLNVAGQELAARHSEDEWPQPAIENFGTAPDEVLYEEQPGFRHAILRAPYFAARVAVYGQKLTRAKGRAFRSARTFDPEWFDTAHGYHFAALIQRDLARYKELFDQ